MPSENLKNWTCSYSGYREDAGRPVRRLEIPRDRVTVILGFGDRLRINPVGSTKSIQSQIFVVGLGEKPLIVNHEGVQSCIERIPPPLLEPCQSRILNARKTN